MYLSSSFEVNRQSLRQNLHAVGAGGILLSGHTKFVFLASLRAVCTYHTQLVTDVKCGI